MTESNLAQVALAMEAHDLLPEETSEVIEKIRKQRWLKTENDAAQLEGLRRQIHLADILLASPCDTD